MGRYPSALVTQRPPPCRQRRQPGGDDQPRQRQRDHRRTRSPQVPGRLVIGWPFPLLHGVDVGPGVGRLLLPARLVRGRSHQEELPDPGPWCGPAQSHLGGRRHHRLRRVGGGPAGDQGLQPLHRRREAPGADR